MNRAERRGNHRFLRRQDLGVTEVAVNRAPNVATDRHIQSLGAAVVAAEQNDGRARSAKGRFVRAEPVVPPAVVQVESRQQRRLAARQAAKFQQVAAEVWDDVTGGAGVLLVDGKEVPPT